MPDPESPLKPDSKPTHQQAEHPDFWDQRFEQGTMPWDAGTAPAQLRAFAAAYPGPAPRVLIPGCGSAHEAAWLDRLGWQVTALDFSAAAIRRAAAQLQGWGGQLLQADFFAHPGAATYDLIYERAFLCALPRRLWPGYGTRMGELARPGGLLAGYFFFHDQPQGPPFGISPAQLEELLHPAFELLEDEAVPDSLPVFAGRERWQVWRRRP